MIRECRSEQCKGATERKVFCVSSLLDYQFGVMARLGVLWFVAVILVTMVTGGPVETPRYDRLASAWCCVECHVLGWLWAESFATVADLSFLSELGIRR